jgi:hypothetical protein
VPREPGRGDGALPHGRCSRAAHAVSTRVIRPGPLATVLFHAVMTAWCLNLALKDEVCSRSACPVRWMWAEQPWSCRAADGVEGCATSHQRLHTLSRMPCGSPRRFVRAAARPTTPPARLRRSRRGWPASAWCSCVAPGRSHRARRPLLMEIAMQASMDARAGQDRRVRRPAEHGNAATNLDVRGWQAILRS